MRKSSGMVLTSPEFWNFLGRSRRSKSSHTGSNGPCSAILEEPNKPAHDAASDTARCVRGPSNRGGLFIFRQKQACLSGSIDLS
eukprot:6852810-Pyramimonas_sp.AAC.1